jgi:hypothetical protein
MSADYADWLRANPAPDLQELVARHAGYDKITPEAWAEYDRAMAEWQERRRGRSEGGGSGALDSDCAAADPEQLCICGLPGVFWRPRKPDKHGKRGRPIWRCEEHRDLWPDYAEEIPARSDGAACDDEDADRIDRYVQRPQYDEPYDDAADFENSINECYREVRERVRAGGEGWEPP